MTDLFNDRGLMGEGVINIPEIRSWVERVGFTGFNEVEILSQKPFNTSDAWGVKSKLWNTYFLYPRKVVGENEKDSSPLYAQVTHVMIVDAWGYDKLTYPVSRKEKYAVLPIRMPGRNQ